MKVFQYLSVVYLAVALLSSLFALNGQHGDLFMTLTVGAIAIGSIHGFIACVRDYQPKYLPLLIAFSLILLTMLFTFSVITEVVGSSGWDAISYLAVAGLIVVGLVVFAVLYSLGLLIWAHFKK